MSDCDRLFSTLKTGNIRNCILLAALLTLLILSHANAQVIHVGLDGKHITALTAEQGDPGEMWFPGTANLIFAATKADGIFQGLTWDNGKSWKAIGPDASPPADIVTIAVQHWGAGPRDGLHLLASIRTPRNSPGDPVLMRKEVSAFDPAGDAWVRADSGITHGDTSTVVNALLPFYFTGHTPPQPILGWTGLAPLRGEPGGIFWEEGTSPRAHIVAMDATPKWFGTDIWAAGTMEQDKLKGVLFRSKDQGLTWKAHSLGGIAPMAHAIAVAPGHPDTLFFLSGVNVWRSTEGMASYTALPVRESTNLIPVAVAFDPLYTTHVYVAVAPEFIVYRTTDLGVNWHRLSPLGRVPTTSITCMTIALMDTVPMGRPPRRGLFLGTAGDGVWMYELDKLIVHAEDVPRPTGESLQLYPNPVSDNISLLLSLSKSRRITVEILDMLGRAAHRATFGSLNPGTHELGLNLTQLATGIYVVRLPGNEHIAPLLLKKL